MLTRRDIAVGKCYVKERTRMAREVIEEVDRHKVKYNAFDLSTGHLLGLPFQVCFKSQIAYWADREAKPAEIARLHPYQPASRFEKAPLSKIKLAELELTRAEMQQTIGHNTIHRC